jgi:hypothetical protein
MMNRILAFVFGLAAGDGEILIGHARRMLEESSAIARNYSATDAA